jgi:hypothetical protein
MGFFDPYIAIALLLISGSCSTASPNGRSPSSAVRPSPRIQGIPPQLIDHISAQAGGDGFISILHSRTHFAYSRARELVRCSAIREFTILRERNIAGKPVRPPVRALRALRLTH